VDSLPAGSQGALITFLDCFEGQNHADMKYRAPCAKKAGLDLTKANACFADNSKVSTLWKARLALPFRSKLSYFPTVLVNGKRLANYTGTFAEMVCSAYKTAGGTLPKGCGGMADPLMLTELT